MTRADTDELVDSYLQRLGAALGQAAAERRIGAVEVLALVLTPIAWPLGVIMLWLSPAWTTRDKLIGTFLPPGASGRSCFSRHSRSLPCARPQRSMAAW